MTHTQEMKYARDHMSLTYAQTMQLHNLLERVIETAGTPTPPAPAHPRGKTPPGTPPGSGPARTS